jgi:hypothetical protein
MTQHNVYRRPQTVREYGYIDGHLVEQPGTANGFLLGWEAIDDEAEAIARRRPPKYVVIGEFVRADGMRFPELAISKAYMNWAGYVQDGPYLPSGGDLPPRKSWRSRHVALEVPA